MRRFGGSGFLPSPADLMAGWLSNCQAVRLHRRCFVAYLGLAPRDLEFRPCTEARRQEVPIHFLQHFSRRNSSVAGRTDVNGRASSVSGFEQQLGRALLDLDVSCIPPRRYDSKELQLMIEAARAPIRRSWHRIPQEYNEAGGRRCTTCGGFFPEHCFYSRSRACKVCTLERGRKYTRTLRGNIVNLLCGARFRAQRQGRQCTLTSEDLFDMVLAQHGCCAYSGVPMEILQPNSHWRLSLERVDNTRGYVAESCVLIASEFNTPDYSIYRGMRAVDAVGSAQWSRDKVLSLPVVRATIVDMQQLSCDIRHAHLKKPDVRVVRARRKPRHDGAWPCCRCGLHKPHGEFYIDTARGTPQSYCKACKKVDAAARKRTLRGQVIDLVKNARSSCTIRKLQFALQPNDLFEMLWNQSGRCYYSGVPLRYCEAHVDWRMSLERLNNDDGYTRDNCVLIAWEFNTSDQSRNKATSQVFGTAQWSQSKVLHIWGPAE
eukprot:gb/GFBE01067923.1/.p1 GENE.gb/GFBE01067923.1/~~gb/GFBE01067923.1/.p1  ORF type:complete len:489 (+),score=33.77 gb/GFBE01067923.1/:1-1467(+)